MTNQKSMGITFGSLGVLGPKAITDIAAKAQDSGYRSIWTVEATGSDALTLLGAAMTLGSRRLLADDQWGRRTWCHRDDAP